MAGIEVQVTGADALVRRLLELGEDAPRVATRALNRTIGTIRTATVRALAQETGLTAARIRRSVTTMRATFTRQIATLSVRGRRIPLIAFGARQTRQGVSVRLGPGRTIVPSTFLARMPSGHRGVFLRAGRARLPIREQFGPSLPGSFVQAHLDEAMLARAEAELVKNLEHEIAFILSQRVPPGDGSEVAA